MENYTLQQSLLKKVKQNPVQTLKLCTGRTAHTGSRPKALFFLDDGTGRGEESASLPGRSLLRERPGTHFTGGWVVPKVGLDRFEKPRRTGIRSPHRPGRSHSLYRIRYQAHTFSS